MSQTPPPHSGHRGVATPFLRESSAVLEDMQSIPSHLSPERTSPSQEGASLVNLEDTIGHICQRTQSFLNYWVLPPIRCLKSFTWTLLTIGACGTFLCSCSCMIWLASLVTAVVSGFFTYDLYQMESTMESFHAMLTTISTHYNRPQEVKQTLINACDQVTTLRHSMWIMNYIVGWPLGYLRTHLESIHQQIP